MFLISIATLVSIALLVDSSGSIIRVARQSNRKVKQCGEAPLKVSGGKLVGGREADIGEFPWHVALFLKVDSDFEYRCGGAIINPSWIITAAHCIEVSDVAKWQVVVGTHNLKNIKSEDKLNVNKIIKHESYKKTERNEFINDIALLKLSEAINLTKTDLVNNICLPTQGQNFFKLLEVSGWGRTTENGSQSDELRTIDIYMQSNEQCKRDLKGLFHPKEMLCAGLRKGRKDTCKGDSGGPIVKHNGGKSTLVGLVSYGIGCARPGMPGVYTRVSSYVDWMKKQISEN